jgi:hypothetical protein
MMNYLSKNRVAVAVLVSLLMVLGFAGCKAFQGGMADEALQNKLMELKMQLMETTNKLAEAYKQIDEMRKSGNIDPAKIADIMAQIALMLKDKDDIERQIRDAVEHAKDNAGSKWYEVLGYIIGALGAGFLGSKMKKPNGLAKSSP